MIYEASEKLFIPSHHRHSVPTLWFLCIFHRNHTQNLRPTINIIIISLIQRASSPQAGRSRVSSSWRRRHLKTNQRWPDGGSKICELAQTGLNMLAVSEMWCCCWSDVRTEMGMKSEAATSGNNLQNRFWFSFICWLMKLEDCRPPLCRAQCWSKGWI